MLPNMSTLFLKKFPNMSTSSLEKMIILQSSDGQSFEIEEEVVALKSQTIKTMIEDGVCATNTTAATIPLPSVSSKILSKVIEYCKRHAELEDFRCRGESFELKEFDADFINVDEATLCDLVRAAYYLKIKSLLDLSCQGVANMLKGRSPEEIMTIFGIKSDRTPEEIDEIRRENAWVFKGI